MPHSKIKYLYLCLIFSENTKLVVYTTSLDFGHFSKFQIRNYQTRQRQVIFWSGLGKTLLGLAFFLIEQHFKIQVRTNFFLYYLYTVITT